MVELQIITKETELAKMKRPLPLSDTLLNVGTKKSKKNKNQDKVYTTSDAQGKEVKAEIGKVVTLSLMASSDAPMVYPILGIGA
jgi:hypothetical protein